MLTGRSRSNLSRTYESAVKGEVSSALATLPRVETPNPAPEPYVEPAIEPAPAAADEPGREPAGAVAGAVEDPAGPTGGRAELICRLGKSDATIYTCDLSKEYVTINADYHT